MLRAQPKYYLTGRDETNKLRFIRCRKDMLEDLPFQQRLQQYIFNEVGIRIQLPILIKVQGEHNNV